MMNHYLREIINCMNYNTVLSQVFFFLLLGFHAHVREVSKVSHLYFYPGFSFIFMAINLLFLYGLETQPGSYGIFGVFFGLFCGAD